MHVKFERCITEKPINEPTRRYYNCVEITDGGIRIDRESISTFYPYGSFGRVEMSLGDFFVAPNGAFPPKGIARQYSPANGEERRILKGLISTINERNANALKRSFSATYADHSKDLERILAHGSNNIIEEVSSILESSSAKTRKLDGGYITLAVIVVILVLLVVGLTQCGGCANSDIAYDEDGFLNMSDGFWEWMRKQ